MNSDPIMLFALGGAIAIAGLVLMAFSLYSASRRGQPIIGTFWAPPEMFVRRELVCNRVGFCLSLAGIAVLLLVVYRLAG